MLMTLCILYDIFMLMLRCTTSRLKQVKANWGIKSLESFNFKYSRCAFGNLEKRNMFPFIIAIVHKLTQLAT